MFCLTQNLLSFTHFMKDRYFRTNIICNMGIICIVIERKRWNWMQYVRILYWSLFFLFSEDSILILEKHAIFVLLQCLLAYLMVVCSFKRLHIFCHLTSSAHKLAYNDLILHYHVTVSRKSHILLLALYKDS